MKTTVKLFLSIIFIVIISCFKENKQKMNDDLHDSPREIHAQLDSQIHKNSYKDTLKYPNIIDENNEYVISKKSISHGVSIYDRIVLDAEKYSLNQLIY